MTTGRLNLAPRRGPNIWESDWHRPDPAYQVGRWLLAIGGSSLMFYGLRRGSGASRLASALGGALACSAASGCLDVTRARGWLEGVYAAWRGRPADAVSEASESSFPASDAPAWTPTTGTGTPGR